LKNIVIIGSSSGIGQALTHQLVENNRVFGSYNQHQPSLENINYFPFNFNALDENFSFDFLPESIDGIVYCPGSILLKNFARYTDEDFLNDYRLQVLGAVRTIRTLLPRLKKSEQGSVVLFSSVAVTSGFPFHTLVSSSKGAIEGFTRALAAELAPKIRVNCIAPSLTDTPLASSLLSNDDKRKIQAERNPMKRIGTSNDIASMAKFLLSDESSWISGQVLAVDGGAGVLKTT
jgi:NAD(P)-dependent dehydrogenase (short-subunit alcohol dehydrogenase family)